MSSFDIDIYYGWDPTANSGQGAFIPSIDGYYAYELNSTNNFAFQPVDPPKLPTEAIKTLNLPTRPSLLSMISPLLRLLNKDIFLNPKERNPDTITINYNANDFSNLFDYFTDLKSISIRDANNSVEIYDIPNYDSLSFFNDTSSFDECLLSGVFSDDIIFDHDPEDGITIKGLLNFNPWKNTSIFSNTRTYTVEAHFAIDYNIELNGKAHYKSAILNNDNFTYEINKNSNGNYGPIDYISEKSGTIDHIVNYTITRDLIQAPIPGEFQWYLNTNVIADQSGTLIQTDDDHYLLDGMRIEAVIIKPQGISKDADDAAANASSKNTIFYTKVINNKSFLLYQDRSLTKPLIYANPDLYRNIVYRLKPFILTRYIYKRMILNATKTKTTIVCDQSNNDINTYIVLLLQLYIGGYQIQNNIYNFIDKGSVAYFSSNGKFPDPKYLRPENQNYILKQGQPDGPYSFVSSRVDRDIALNTKLDPACSNKFYYIEHSINDVTGLSGSGVKITIGNTYLHKITLQQSQIRTFINFFFNYKQPNTNGFWRVKDV